MKCDTFPGNQVFIIYTHTQNVFEFYSMDLGQRYESSAWHWGWGDESNYCSPCLQSQQMPLPWEEGRYLGMLQVLSQFKPCLRVHLDAGTLTRSLCVCVCVCVCVSVCACVFVEKLQKIKHFYYYLRGCEKQCMPIFFFCLTFCKTYMLSVLVNSEMSTVQHQLLPDDIRAFASVWWEYVGVLHFS